MKRSLVLAAICVCVGVGADRLMAGSPSEVEWDERNHLFYVGIGYGPTLLSTSADQREINGIEYTFDAEADDLGGLFYAGWWITEHVGIEVGTRNYGTVDVPFAL